MIPKTTTIQNLYLALNKPMGVEGPLSRKQTKPKGMVILSDKPVFLKAENASVIN